MWLFLQALCFCWFALSWYPCCCNPCEGCVLGTTPRRIQIDFGGAFDTKAEGDPGWPDFACPGDNCEDWQTTSWILHQFGGEVPSWMLDKACNFALMDGTTLPCSGAGRFNVCALTASVYFTGWLIYIQRMDNFLGGSCGQSEGGWFVDMDDRPYDCSEAVGFGSAEAIFSWDHNCIYNTADGHTLTPL